MTTARLKSDINSSETIVQLGGNGLVRFFDMLFVLRPTLMFPLWTMTLCGYHLAPSSGGLTYLQWLLLSVSLSSLFGLVYLLNQFRDRESDQLNSKLHLVSAGILSKRKLIVEMIVLSTFVIAGLILSGFWHLYALIIVIFAIAGIIYNYTPLALEQNPVGGIIAGVVGGWLLLHLGGMISGGELSLTREAPYVIAFTSACILTGLLDRSGDERAGKMTFTVVYGTQATIAFGLFGLVLTGLWGVYNQDWVIVAPTLVALPILIASFMRKSVGLAVQANKAAIFLLSVMAGLYYPVYLVVILLYFLFAKWYHRQRFSMDYPSFKSET